MAPWSRLAPPLGAGKRVYLVSPHDWSWKHHPRVRVFDTLEAAVTAIRRAIAVPSYLGIG
jgi:hypothetical protein